MNARKRATAEVAKNHLIVITVDDGSQVTRDPGIAYRLTTA